MSAHPNDPTRAGAPVTAGALLSLPEIEVLCLKAARGAGMEWGMAEEAGYAARWLAMFGLPGPELVLGHLTASAVGGWADLRPEIAQDGWQGRDGQPLCPIAVGAALADRAGPDGACLQISTTSCPALILPFLALAAQARGGALTLLWSGGKLSVGANGPDSVEAAQALAGLDRDSVQIVATVQDIVPAPRHSGRSIGRAAWQALDGFALRTTVPATDQSRADAGAGTSDND